MEGASDIGSDGPNDRLIAPTIAATEPAILRRLLELSRLVLPESDSGRVLTKAMDYLVEISGAEYGMIILFDAGRENLVTASRHTCGEKMGDIPAFRRSLIDIVKRDMMPISLRPAFNDAARQNNVAAEPLAGGSAIGVPLSHGRVPFGMVYLESQAVHPAFTSEVFQFTQSFADFIAPAAHGALERQRLQNVSPGGMEAQLRGGHQFEFIIGHDPKIVKILKLVAQIADADATVLIKGENGTGKELIAWALHCNSRRQNQPFVPINCGAIPENLLESELFGHARGAFTGAIKDKIGWFESAVGGTIFLDEVSEMTQALQVKLLRVLQTGEYSRVGSTEIRHCKVRVVAATNRDLQTLVIAGTFREDVYYRLNVIEIELPPLRERKDDIPLLSCHFLKTFGARYNKTHLRLSPAAERLLLAYHYPGNIRELENIMQRAVVLVEGEVIESHHLPISLNPEGTASNRKDKLSIFKIAKQCALQKFEREYIFDCLKMTAGNISRAAQMAGIDVKNFHVKMKKYGIDPHFFKKGLE